MDLNDRTIRALPLAEDHAKADKVYLDDALTGFGLRCRNGKQVSWVIQYRASNGQQIRATLGSVKKIDSVTARKAAKKYLAEVTLGADPRDVKRKQRAQRSFGSVVDDYLETKRRTVRPRTFIEEKRYLTDAAYWRPFHSRPIGSIKREEVAARLRTIEKATGPVAVVRAQFNLSALYTWALQEGFCESNPVIGTRPAAKLKSRDRVLWDDELIKIWNACSNNDHDTCIKLLALLGQRRSEVGGMRWSELDLDAGLWELPAVRVKNGREHFVALPDFALQIIAAVPKRDGSDQLFGLHAIGYQNWGKGKDALDARTNPPLDAWRVHDLRRTCATGMANLGVQPHVIEATLNHISGAKAGVAGIYNKIRICVRRAPRWRYGRITCARLWKVASAR